MTMSPADNSPQTGPSGLKAVLGSVNPLAIAIFAVAMLIGGVLIWLSFSGNDAGTDELVVALAGNGDTEALLTGDPNGIVAIPQVLETEHTITNPDPADPDHAISDHEMPGQEMPDHAAADSAAPDNTAPDHDTDTHETPGDAPADGTWQKVGTLAPLPPGAPLRRAPLRGLYEETQAGLLPIISADGRRAVASYARPFETPAAGTTARPRIAIMIMGLGLNKTFASRAIEQLPPQISLAYTPYAGKLQDQINAARADGHEVAIELPMEPFDYPDNDPGPYTLLTSLPKDANAKRLEWLLARATGYFAAVNRQGGRYLSEAEALTPVLTVLRNRGVGFIDTGEGARNVTAKVLPAADYEWALARRVIDAAKSARQIDRALANLEAQAINDGIALGIGTALPITVDRVSEWTQSLDEKGIDLVPVSAVLAHNSQAAQGGPAPTSHATDIAH